MSTVDKTDLELRIIDVDRRTVQNAAVLGAGTRAKLIGPGRYRVPDLRRDELNYASKPTAIYQLNFP